jgi:hypothetical protein
VSFVLNSTPPPETDLSWQLLALIETDYLKDYADGQKAEPERPFAVKAKYPGA